MAETTGTTVAVTDDTFSADVLSSSTPVLVDFWATWCGPCKMIAPVLEEIATEKAGALTVAKLDVDANPATARDFQVVSIPTLIVFKDGAPVKRIVGAKGKAALLRDHWQLAALPCAQPDYCDVAVAAESPGPRFAFPPAAGFFDGKEDPWPYYVWRWTTMQADLFAVWANRRFMPPKARSFVDYLAALNARPSRPA